MLLKGVFGEFHSTGSVLCLKYWHVSSICCVSDAGFPTRFGIGLWKNISIQIMPIFI